MSGAAESGEFLLELLDFRPAEELAVRSHPLDGGVDRRSKAPPLRGNVNERDWGVLNAGVLVHRLKLIRRGTWLQ
jgi:hypothetical protein